ncbi:glycosyltransferase family 4 protein [Aureimonas psammosilenae]|uniref:glycosyltransferase family 4 protein n=1 Tax=Aureimonas psammosilenae TaxID=2495496 RepID=UPI001260AAA5|nr:glycosyltransferase family 4 protein [Aureimonas psammosilenae]
MRVAFYAPMKAPDDPVPSGEGRMARLFLAALERAGFEPDVASRLRAYEGGGDEARQRKLEGEGRAEAERLVAHYRALGLPERPALWFTYHLYHKAPDHLGPAVSGALGIPYVLAEASHSPKRRDGHWARGYAVAQDAISRADRVYVLNSNDRACLEPIAKAGALLDLPPFIDTTPFRVDEAERRRARQALAVRYGFEEATPLVLTVAMMRRDQKLRSYRVLADSFARLGNCRWNALLVGDGPAEDEVRALMEPFGSRVAFAGRLEGDELREAYAGADIYAWPSVKEAFGLAFIEAAASGLAVMAGRSGGIHAIVDHGRTGLVVPAGDSHTLAEGLEKLLLDPALVSSMGRAGAERAEAVNGLDAAATLLRADLLSLVSRQSGMRDA